MKGLLLIVFVTITADLNAQDFPSNIDKLIAKSKLFKLQKDANRSLLKPNSFQAGTTVPRVYALPQDGMPCVVPDTHSLVSMPNAAKGNAPPSVNQMPNAMPEHRLLPKQQIDSK